MQLFLHIINFFFLQRLAYQLYFLRIHVILNRKINSFLLPQFNDLLVPSMIVIKLFSNHFAHFFQLPKLADFQVFNQVESSCFIISHVSIPGFSKLSILYFLSLFNVYQLSLLSNSHIVTLSLLFVIAPPIKNFLKPIGHHVVTNMFIPFTNFIHDPKNKY